jgi:2'-5' RNA ligase
MINTNFGKYFIAIDVPCELKDEISFKTKNYFNSKDLVVNNKSKYHITLFYLGQTSIDVAKNLFFKVPDFKPFQLTLSNIGYFNTRVIG